MKYLLLLMLLISCSKRPSPPPQIEYVGTSCTTKQLSDGVEVTCPDGSKTFLASPSSCNTSIITNGVKISCTDGSFAYIYNGTSSSCSVEGNANGATVTCSDGSSAIITNGASGSNGIDGNDGVDGVDGIDGSNCTVTSIVNGAAITCGSDTVHIYNGEITREVIDPCGDNPGETDEVILVMADGSLIGHYSKGSSDFLYSLSPGAYVTGDKQKCHFNILNDFTIVW